MSFKGGYRGATSRSKRARVFYKTYGYYYTSFHVFHSRCIRMVMGASHLDGALRNIANRTSTDWPGYMRRHYLHRHVYSGSALVDNVVPPKVWHLLALRCIYDYNDPLYRALCPRD